MLIDFKAIHLSTEAGSRCMPLVDIGGVGAVLRAIALEAYTSNLRN